jgi:hypothetical protein
MPVGAILGSLIAAGPASWMAGILAALGLAGAGVAYDRAVRSDRPAPAPVGASGRSGLSFAPALIALGVVIGVSIAAELAASLWSTLLLREEAPKLAAISGVGAAFFSACQAALRFNADATGFVSATFGSSSPRSGSPPRASPWSALRPVLPQASPVSP